MTAAVATALPTSTGAMTVKTVRVTPAVAEKWLGKNVHNRKLNARRVRMLARAMERGEWMLTGEAIKFAADGTMIDGQHRCAAVVESGKSVPFLVIEGLPLEAQDVLDTGRARTAANQLDIHGHANPELLAATARIVLAYESGFTVLDGGSVDVSHRQILDFAEGNEMLAFACTRGRTVTKGADLRPSVAAAAIYLLTKVNDQKAQEFFDRLADGVNLDGGSPILALRARLRSTKDERSHLPVHALLSLTFRSWNAWRGGRNITSLPLYRNGEIIACPEPKR